jgi:RimJ/RimL family protein N-acetyltransferase
VTSSPAWTGTGANAYAELGTPPRDVETGYTSRARSHGLELIRRGRAVEAEGVLRALSDSGNAGARTDLGVLHFRAGVLNLAEQEWQQAAGQGDMPTSNSQDLWIRSFGPLAENATAYDQLVNSAVTLHAGPTPSAPALVLRPWCAEDVDALVEAFQDSALRHWTSTPVENDADGARWVQAQQRGWAAGGRFGFAVLEAQPDVVHGQLVGNVVLKEVVSGKPSAEVGYWTAAHARGRSVAPRALEVLTDWAFDTFGADGLERLELLHQEDNLASCRVAQKSGYEFDRVLPAAPPSFPLDGHLHIRHTDS